MAKLCRKWRCTMMQICTIDTYRTIAFIYALIDFTYEI